MPFGLSKLRKEFPELRMEIINRNSFQVFGKLHVIARNNMYSIDEYFDIKIVAKNFPFAIPVCDEVSNKNRSFHINPLSNSLCLSSPREYFEVMKSDPTIIAFIKKLLIPFFFSFRYFQHYGEAPFGELSHGLQGIFEDYSTRFNIEPQKIFDCLHYTFNEAYRGHHLCLCGSSKILRKCHGRLLKEVFKTNDKVVLARDYLFLLKTKSNELIQKRKYRQTARIACKFLGIKFIDYLHDTEWQGTNLSTFSFK